MYYITKIFQVSSNLYHDLLFWHDSCWNLKIVFWANISGHDNIFSVYSSTPMATITGTKIVYTILNVKHWLTAIDVIIHGGFTFTPIIESVPQNHLFLKHC